MAIESMIGLGPGPDGQAVVIVRYTTDGQVRFEAVPGQARFEFGVGAEEAVKFFEDTLASVRGVAMKAHQLNSGLITPEDLRAPGAGQVNLADLAARMTAFRHPNGDKG
jgi:hypothetical protein